MVNALTNPLLLAKDRIVQLHQLLHGYAEGHRLIEGSIKIPDDLTRIILRMSDLSGSNVSTGFEEYITGYPLTKLKAYALATSWYAPEMPRPGCVWTHTIIIPEVEMSKIPSLDRLRVLFRRPRGHNDKGSYAKPLFLDGQLTSNHIESPNSNLLRNVLCLITAQRISQSYSQRKVQRNLPV